MRKRFWHTFVVTFLALWLCVPAIASDQRPTTQTRKISTNPQTMRPRAILKLKPGTTIASLKARSNEDILVLKNGNRLTVGALRNLDDFARKLRQTKPGQTPPVLRMKPASTGERIRDGQHLASVLAARPQTATVQMPSGHLYTVGQVQLVKGIVDKRIGLGITHQEPSPTARSIKMTKGMPGAEWRKLASEPDDTVIEVDGKRIMTVREFRQLMTNVGAVRNSLVRAVDNRQALTPTEQTRRVK